jgi:hypothetical protein
MLKPIFRQFKYLLFLINYCIMAFVFLNLDTPALDMLKYDLDPKIH